MRKGAVLVRLTLVAMAAAAGSQGGTEDKKKPEKVPCPQQFIKLCPDVPLKERVRCALRVEKLNRNSLSTACKVFAMGLVMNSHRESMEVVQAKPFNEPSGCDMLGASPDAKGRWWRDVGSQELSKAIDEIDFTLVSQVTTSRMWMVPFLCERWPGDIVISMAVTREHPYALPAACMNPSNAAFAQRREALAGRGAAALSADEPVPEESLRAIRAAVDEAVQRAAELEARAKEAAKAEKGAARQLSEGGVQEAAKATASSDLPGKSMRPHAVDSVLRQIGDSQLSTIRMNGAMQALIAANRRRREKEAERAAAVGKGQDATGVEQDQGPPIPSGGGARRLTSAMRQYAKDKSHHSKQDNAEKKRAATPPTKAPLGNLPPPLRPSLPPPQSSAAARNRTVTLVQVVVKDPLAPFPINLLRNRAMCRVATTHAFYTDVDLWPSETLYSRLHATKYLDPKRFTNPTHAFVVPAFEVIKSPTQCLSATAIEKNRPFERNRCTELSIPRNFSGIQTCVAERRCRQFDQGGNPEGHATTGYRQWFTPQAGGDAAAPLVEPKPRPLRCLRSNRYEPYLVLPAAGSTPLYEEVFTGYGKNKIQHTVHLLAKGFTFSVLSRSFVVHFMHARSENRMIWDVQGNDKMERFPSQRMVNNDVYERFLGWLTATYGGNYKGADELHRPDAAALAQKGSIDARAKDMTPSDNGAAPLRQTHICENAKEGLTWTERDKIRKEQERQAEARAPPTFGSVAADGTARATSTATTGP